MKKIVAVFVLMFMFFATVPFSANAQSRYYQKQCYYKQTRSGHLIRKCQYVNVRKPSFYRRHRNYINMGIGAGSGAILGGIIGGRKGALIGTGLGTGVGALYTYKIRPKKRHYRKIRNY